ncbi:transcriptional regulator [Companilactobacillus sp.]|uniref:transcriptional regulator n=1 Tax=Companilactobacillus sp. TaxID=2767905 RepID=UPI0025C5F3AE|nr:transcriptional regulator [Companilactobacillus sp.]
MELSKRKLAYLEELYSDYTNINNLIATRVLELDHPWKQTDENIGGGRSSHISRPQEEIVIKRENDIRLQWLLKLQVAGDKAVEQFTDEQQRMYELKYLSNDYYDWEIVGDIMGCSHTSIYRKRYKFLELLGKQIGYC